MRLPLLHGGWSSALSRPSGGTATGLLPFCQTGRGRGAICELTGLWTTSLHTSSECVLTPLSQKQRIAIINL